MKLLRFLSAKKTKKKTDMVPLECLPENVIPLDILLHYVGSKQFRYSERERERERESDSCGGGAEND